MEQTPFVMHFMIEKKEGFGEDSDPLSFYSEDAGYAATGVFDGLGGSGASLVHSTFGERTSAYVASRLIKATTADYVKQHIKEDGFSLDSADFKQALIKCLQDEKNRFSREKKSLLRSSIVREYPTTIAVVIVKSQDSNYIVDSYWAGDSRNYLLNETCLKQLSNDDLQVAYDPLENIKNDAPISNCVCLDRPFNIKKMTLSVNKPFLVFSASDGCFGYLKTPMHFESVLLNTLFDSEVLDINDWKKGLMREMRQTAGDDISFSLIGVGYESFSALKKSLQNRKESIDKIIAEYENLENALDEAKKGVSAAENALVAGEATLWSIYKKSYLDLFIKEENDEKRRDS